MKTRTQLTQRLSNYKHKKAMPKCFFCTENWERSANIACICERLCGLNSPVVTSTWPHLFLWPSHTTFWKYITKVTPFSNKGPILHQDSISFHLSHQPPLSVMCNFYVVKMSLLGGKVSLSLHKKWHITDRGGWWLKWKLILSRWRIGPKFAWTLSFVDTNKSSLMCLVNFIGIPMKNWALIWKWGHFCNRFPKSWIDVN